MKPSSALIIVLLPAPFGPSRPTAPAGKLARDVARARSSSRSDGDVVQRHDGSGGRRRSASGRSGRQRIGSRSEQAARSAATLMARLLADTGLRAATVRLRTVRSQRAPQARARRPRSRRNAMTLAMCSSSGRPSSSAPALQVVALHGAGKRLVLHPLHHRRRLEVEHALRRPHQRRGGDEARHLVAGEQRLLEPRLARPRRCSRRARGWRAITHSG